MTLFLIAAAGALLSFLWVFYFCSRMRKEGYILLPCRVCGRSVLVSAEKPEAVTKAERIFKGKAEPFVICRNCQA